MPKYKINVVWEGENSVIRTCESEEDAINYGYDELANGCASCNVEVELVEDDNDENEEDGENE